MEAKKVAEITNGSSGFPKRSKRITVGFFCLN